MHVSPRHTIEDWNFGRCTDIDIAEDQLSGWIFAPAQALSSDPESGVAILMLLSVCFEALQSYHMGEVAGGGSTEFLIAGLALVFPDVSPMAREKYAREVRHGLLQGSIFRRSVIHRHNASFPDFGLLPDGKTLGINPWYVLAETQAHCNAYFAVLRRGVETEKLDRFNAVMAIRKKL